MFINLVQTMRKKYTQEEVADIFKKAGSNIELAHDPDNKIGPLFNATGFPTMIVLGKSGKIEAVNVGNLGDLEKRVKGQLDALIAGKPVPPSARPAVAQKKRGRPNDLVGKPAPKFTFKTMKGNTIDNNTLKAHPATIINVVAPNCGYCKKQTPRLEKIRAEYESKGVKFINLVQTMRKKYTPEEVTDIFKKAGSNIELAHDPDNKIGPLFNATGFPTMIVLGKSGKVEAVNVGNIGDLEKRVKGQLDALIAGKPLPKVASAPSKSRKRPAEALVGKTAPAFSLTTHAGKAVSDTDFKNHPATVLNFVAPNCGFCKRQLPNVEKLRAEYEAKGVRFVNVHQTMRKEYTKEEAASVFKGAGSNLELATDAGNTVGKAYKATSFPTMIVVGKDGKVSNVNIGAKANLESLLRGQLDTLIKKAGK